MHTAGVLPEALEFGLQHGFPFRQGVEPPVAEGVLDRSPESPDGIDLRAVGGPRDHAHVVGQAGVAVPPVETGSVLDEHRPRRRIAPADRHMLIQDGAGFHRRDGDPGLPDHVRVVTRPASSPELNPIEGLWAQIKDTLCHRVFNTLAELEAVRQTQRQRFWQDARRVHSLVFDWLLAQANASSRPVIPLN